MTITTTTCCLYNGYDYYYTRILNKARNELVVSIVLYVFVFVKGV